MRYYQEDRYHELAEGIIDAVAVLVVSAPAQGAPERRSPTSRLNTSGSLLRARGSLRKSPPRMGPVTTAGFDDTCGTSAKSLLSSVIPA